MAYMITEEQMVSNQDFLLFCKFCRISSCSNNFFDVVSPKASVVSHYYAYVLPFLQISVLIAN